MGRSFAGGVLLEPITMKMEVVNMIMEVTCDGRGLWHVGDMGRGGPGAAFRGSLCRSIPICRRVSLGGSAKPASSGGWRHSQRSALSVLGALLRLFLCSQPVGFP